MGLRTIRGRKRRNARPGPPPPYYLVAVTRVTTYRVRAVDEDSALDAMTDGDGYEVDQTTLNMRADLDADQTIRPEPDHSLADVHQRIADHLRAAAASGPLTEQTINAVKDAVAVEAFSASMRRLRRKS